MKIPKAKTVNKKKLNPHLSPEEFARLVECVQEPYATMIEAGCK